MFEVIFALAFLLLLIIRFVYMKTTQQSSIPDHTPKSQKLAAKIVHYGMYICLALIPFSGLIIGWLFWLDLKDGFLINLVIGVHEFCSINYLLAYWIPYCRCNLSSLKKRRSLVLNGAVLEGID